MASPSEKQRSQEESPASKELLHRTKLIQFLGRTTPIILQNDNGPCPLLAICNVLLLRNNLNLSSDVAEVSQEKLLSLVAERLIDSNSNVNNKDAGFVENQQQNISDAIDLLPRLATGIDVNIKFTRIDDFEFTRECAIFDLLDIPLYHGWIVDPQDSDTYNSIGLKSYNTLMGELVALDTQNLASDLKKNTEEDCIDFAAATTASLGVPSPSLSKGKPFDDSPRSVSKEQKERKGDLEEEEELLRALKLSETESSPSANNVNVVNTVDNNLSEKSNGAYTSAEIHGFCQQEPSTCDDNNVINNHNDDLITSETVPGQDVCSSSEGEKDQLHSQIDTPSEKHDSKDEITSSEGDKDKLHGQIHTPSEKHDCNNEIKNTSIDVSEKHDSKDELTSSEGDNNDKLHGQIDTPSEKHDSHEGMKKTSVDVSEKHYGKDEIAASEGDRDKLHGQIDTSSEKHDSNDEIEKTRIGVSEKHDNKDEIAYSEVDKDKLHGQIYIPSEKHDSKDEIEKTSIDVSFKSEKDTHGSNGSDPPPPVDILVHDTGDGKIQDQSVLTAKLNVENIKSVGKTTDISCSSAPIAVLDSSKDIGQTIDESKPLTSSADGSEPIYEGEECMLETSTKTYGDREPMYEGEVVLAEQVDKGSNTTDCRSPKYGITPKQGELIRNFLKSSASQLTIYGLFSLLDGLKERELCVFFRNNHFNTMFKFEGELYLLATDQGYINQPDLVWEKLNEVNGDTVFMTGNFKEFKVDNHDTRSWDEQNALANTADYLASIDNATQENTSFNSDLQLAIALQQQEFDQQQQPQRNSQQSTASGGSRLVTGPQHVQPSRPRNSSSSPKQESKSSKEKCTVM